MCLSSQVQQDENSIPGVQHSTVFLCDFFEIQMQWGKKRLDYKKVLIY